MPLMAKELYQLSKKKETALNIKIYAMINLRLLAMLLASVQILVLEEHSEKNLFPLAGPQQPTV